MINQFSCNGNEEIAGIFMDLPEAVAVKPWLDQMAKDGKTVQITVTFGVTPHWVRPVLERPKSIPLVLPAGQIQSLFRDNQENCRRYDRGYCTASLTIYYDDPPLCSPFDPLPPRRVGEVVHHKERVHQLIPGLPPSGWEARVSFYNETPTPLERGQDTYMPKPKYIL